MAVTLDADPSSPTFNCYSTLAEAIDYQFTRLHIEDWANSAASEKQKALMWATRQLDTLSWKGVRAKEGQNLAFPRKDLSYTEYSNGYAQKITISETEVPEFLKQATAELALTLLGSDTTALSGTEGFNRIKVDVIDLGIEAGDRASWFSSSVRNLVKRFLISSNKYNIPVVRVG